MKVLKRFLPYLRPYRLTIAMTLLLGLVMNAVMLANAQMVKVILDDIMNAKNPEKLAFIPLLIVGLYFISGIVRFTHLYILRYTGDRLAIDLRKDIHRQYTNLSVDYHISNESGALISKASNDVNNLQQGLSLFADVIREPVNMLCLLGYALYTSWKLTLLVFLAAPILIATTKSLGRSVRKYSYLMQEAHEKFINVIKETIDGIRVVKSFNLEKRMQNRFKDVAENFLFTRRKILSREEVSSPISELLAAVLFAGILYLAGWQVIHGELTAGGFGSLIFALGALQGPIKKLQDVHIRAQHTIAAGARVLEVLDTPLSVKEPTEAGRAVRKWNPDWEKISFEDVKFAYGAKEVLNGVNLEVKRGEMVAIVGSSGAGKTTLVNLLLRFYDVTSGAIKIEGADIRDFMLSDLRNHVGLVTQDVFLFNESVFENIVADEKDFPPAKVSNALQAAHAKQFVEKFAAGVDTKVGDRGARLSGGERQRISIARAVFKDAPILVLDEATSSLDSESEKLVQDALDGLMAGRTTFVIAHRLSTIQRADRIVVLQEGKLVEQGTHQELLKGEGIYKRLYDLQFS